MTARRSAGPGPGAPRTTTTFPAPLALFCLLLLPLTRQEPGAKSLSNQTRQSSCTPPISCDAIRSARAGASCTCPAGCYGSCFFFLDPELIGFWRLPGGCFVHRNFFFLAGLVKITSYVFFFLSLSPRAFYSSFCPFLCASDPPQT